MLDEASRSVRRTFVGSIASIVGMFAVIGAAGAYGASERLNVKSLSTALTTLQIKLAPGSESIAPIPARTMTLASLPPGNAVITTVEPDTAIVREVAPVAAPAAPAIPDVPALVRLESPFFNFAEASPNGDDIRFAEGLPKTRSGKIMRRLLKQIATGGEIKGDTTTLEDLSVLTKLASADES